MTSDRDKGELKYELVFVAQAPQPMPIHPQHKWNMPAAIISSMAAATHHPVVVLPGDSWQNHQNPAPPLGTLGRGRVGSQCAGRGPGSSTHAPLKSLLEKRVADIERDIKEYEEKLEFAGFGSKRLTFEQHQPSA